MRTTLSSSRLTSNGRLLSSSPLPQLLRVESNKYNAAKKTTTTQTQTQQLNRFFSSSSTSSISDAGDVGGDDDGTNGDFLNYAMLYNDSIAYLICNQLGIPQWIATTSTNSITPSDIAKQFNLSIRGSSALLVTLCRMKVVSVYIDDDDSVDDIQYILTDNANKYFGNPDSSSYVSPFIDTFTTNFITPDALLRCARPEHDEDGTDIMTEHLEQSNEEETNNARHFMKHMNAQSYSCAKEFPNVLFNDDETINNDKDKDLVMVDVGGGSAIYTLEAVKQNPNLYGIVYELPYIKPITEEFIIADNLSSRIAVESGDFFKEDEPLLKPLPDGNGNGNGEERKADIVLFANILHDWKDETNMKLLKKAYDSLYVGGRVVISEILLADDISKSSSSATSMNIIMLPYTKGRQYRSKELHRRLTTIGFINPRTKHLVDDYSLIIADKPNNANNENYSK
jgi:hypothetical protein